MSTAPPEPALLEVKREERKIVEETEKAGGTVHEFNPDASPEQKAAHAGKVMINCLKRGHDFLLILCCLEHAFGIRHEECRSRDRIGHRHRMIQPIDFNRVIIIIILMN